MKKKNWVVPKATEQLLTKTGWVRFVTTESSDVSAQHLLARLGCEPQRLILENPRDYYQDYLCSSSFLGINAT